jgi:hypothetical protein
MMTCTASFFTPGEQPFQHEVPKNLPTTVVFWASAAVTARFAGTVPEAVGPSLRVFDLVSGASCNNANYQFSRVVEEQHPLACSNPEHTYGRDTMTYIKGDSEPLCFEHYVQAYP